MRCVFKGTLTTLQEKAHFAKTNASTIGEGYFVHMPSITLSATIFSGLCLGRKKGGRILCPLKIKSERMGRTGNSKVD